MIKLDHVVLVSPEQMGFIIEGIRNPMNNWDESDSEYETAGYDIVGFRIGIKDHFLMEQLVNAGTDHRKFMRMIQVYMRITAPLYWWQEFDIYKVGIVANSCSTMHKIAEKEFTLEDFSYEHLISDEDETVNLGNYIHRPCQDFSSNGNAMMKSLCDLLNHYREKYLKTKDKKYLWNIIQLLPNSYNQIRNVMMDYEELTTIYRSYRNHKLDEWCDFCRWIEQVPYSELIMKAAGLDDNSINAKLGVVRHI